MNIRDFRIGLRLLMKEPGYSAVAVLGLSIGFAVFFLLFGYVRYSFSYDAAVPQGERIYLIIHRLNIIGKPAWYELAPLPFLDVAKRSGLVEDGSIVNRMSKLPFKVGDRVQQIDLIAVNPEFQQMFGIQPLEGDLHAALTQPDRLALTVTSAYKLFGDSHVVGKSVQISGKPYVVSAILADPPSNSTVNYAAMAGVVTSLWPEDFRTSLFAAWGNIGAKIYVKLKPGASAAALTEILQNAADNSPLAGSLDPATLQRLGSKKVMDIGMGALPDMYFDSRIAQGAPGSSQHGDKRTVLGLAAIALLILALATANYLNLATMRTLGRQREIAMRKVLGAEVGRVIGQFLAESTVVSLTATGLGLLLAWLLLPLFSDLINRQIDDVFTPMTISLSLALGVLVGVLSGAYPAWVALHVRPPQTLAGRGSSETIGGLWLRRVLSVLQFSAVMGLTGVTFTIAWQTHYASQANPGFDPTPMVVVDLPDDMKNPASRSLRGALARLPGVTGVTVTDDPVGRGFIGLNSTLTRDGHTNASIVWRMVGADFFEVFGIHPLAGRLFDTKLDAEDTQRTKESNIVLNRAAVQALGFASPEAAIGQIFNQGSGNDAQVLHVIGVTPDIRHQSLHEVPQPMAYTVDGVDTSVLTVRTNGDVRSLESEAESLAARYFPNDVVDIRRAQTYIVENYKDDLRLSKLLGLASVIAIAIAAFGIYVLSTYSVQRLAKQIVLRKLLGAGHLDIVRLVGREFVTLIAVGAVIGLPLAALANAQYLATFVERAPMGAWPLVGALLLAAVVALGATVRHTMIAIRMAPARLLTE